MADRVKGIVIEIGGDTTPLTKSLADVNGSLKSTQAELNDVNRLLKLDPTNTELLAQKQKLLSRQTTDTASKLSTLRSAQDQLQKKFEDGAEATEEEKTQMDRLAREIVATSNQMTSLAAETEKTNAAMEDGGEKTGLVSGAMEALKEKVTGALPEGLQGLAGGMDGASKSGLALVGTMASVVAGLAKMTLETAETAKEIDIMSQRMGMTVEEYQEWDYVLKRVGTSAEEAQGDLSALAEKAKDAATGSGEAAELFAELGVQVKNSKGEFKSQNELFEQVIYRLQGVTDATRRNAIASALLSTTGENLVPVLNMTSQELATLKQEAQDTGAVMDEETIGKFQQLNDAMASFKQSGDTVKNNLAVVLLPILTKLFEVIASIPAPVLEIVLKIGMVVTTVVLAVKAVKEMTGALGAAGNAIGKLKDWFNALNPTMAKTVLIVASIVTALIAVLGLIALIQGKNLDNLSSIGKMQGDVQSNITSGLPRYAGGTPYHQGGWALVGERGPELVKLPQGTSVTPAAQTKATLAGAGGDTFYVTIDAKNVREFNDIVRMAKTARQQRRAR